MGLQSAGEGGSDPLLTGTCGSAATGAGIDASTDYRPAIILVRECIVGDDWAMTRCWRRSEACWRRSHELGRRWIRRGAKRMPDLNARGFLSMLRRSAITWAIAHDSRRTDNERRCNLVEAIAGVRGDPEGAPTAGVLQEWRLKRGVGRSYDCCSDGEASDARESFLAMENDEDDDGAETNAEGMELAWPAGRSGGEGGVLVLGSH